MIVGSRFWGCLVLRLVVDCLGDCCFGAVVVFVGYFVGRFGCWL